MKVERGKMGEKTDRLVGADDPVRPCEVRTIFVGRGGPVAVPKISALPNGGRLKF